MTLRERIREFRRQAVAKAEPGIKGKFDRQQRQEWAESRKRAGWSKHLVDDAIGAGPLESVRAAIREEPRTISRRLAVAMRALGVLDTGRPVEVQPSRYGEDVTPLQRRTYAPARLRAV